MTRKLGQDPLSGHLFLFTNRKRNDEQLVLMNHGWLLTDAALRS